MSGSKAARLTQTQHQRKVEKQKKNEIGKEKKDNNGMGKEIGRNKRWYNTKQNIKSQKGRDVKKTTQEKHRLPWHKALNKLSKTHWKTLFFLKKNQNASETISA